MSDDEDIAMILHAEQQAKALAGEQFLKYNPFLNLPNQVTMRVLDDYRRMLISKNVTGDELREMISNDFTKACEGLRSKTASMIFIGAPRHAVLLHVALLVGIEATLALRNMWAALRDKNWEKAADELLLSEWPRMAGSDISERQRVIDLVHVMRSGVFSNHMTMDTH